ncbi:hypothetical protein AMTRI_Chr08g166930 [Amborella trichopoda]
MCFNCNEKFGPGHRCKKLFRIEGNWSDDEGEEPVETQTTRVDYELPEISIHAISGARSSQTMRVQGEMRPQWVIFLIDSGSIHNFINSMITKKAGLIPKSEGNFEVVWLSSLGPIVWDFSKLQMAFKIDGKEVVLNGMKAPVNKIVDEINFDKEAKKRKDRIVL